MTIERIVCMFEGIQMKVREILAKKDLKTDCRIMYFGKIYDSYEDFKSNL